MTSDDNFAYATILGCGAWVVIIGIGGIVYGFWGAVLGTGIGVLVCGLTAEVAYFIIKKIGY
jgi:hypothetical protein